IRLNVPGMLLYCGSIAPGNFRGRDVTIQDVFEAVGANAAGKMTDADLLEIENVACHGAGACGGPYTANTNAVVMGFIRFGGGGPRQRFGHRSVEREDGRGRGEIRR